MKEKDWKAHLQWLLKEEIPTRKKLCQDRTRKARQLETLTERISAMREPTFITLTLNDEYVNKPNNVIIRAFRESIQRTFGNDILWCLVSDYGEHTHRLHFHGFIDVEVDNLIKRMNAKYIKHNKFYSVYRCESFFIGSLHINKSYGSTLENAVRYCVKYITKDGQNVPHQLYGSRKGQPLAMSEVALAMFGDQVVFEG